MGTADPDRAVFVAKCVRSLMAAVTRARWTGCRLYRTLTPPRTGAGWSSRTSLASTSTWAARSRSAYRVAWAPPCFMCPTRYVHRRNRAARRPDDGRARGPRCVADRDTQACAILRALRTALPAHITVTCKIRVLPTAAESACLAQALEATDIDAIAVHSRWQSERPRDAGHEDLVRAVVDVRWRPQRVSLHRHRAPTVARIRRAGGSHSRHC